MVTIIASGHDLVGYGPRGLWFVDEVLDEANLRAEKAAQLDVFARRVRVLGRALQREFGGRVKLRLLNPWTLGGLWFVVRHRVRTFPCVVIDRQSYELETSLEELVEAIRQALSRYEHTLHENPGHGSHQL